MTQDGKSEQDALSRFDAALLELEGHLASMIAEEKEKASQSVLEGRIQDLTEERDRILAELEAERARVRRLKAANEEVSGRLAAVQGTLKTMVPAMPG